MSQYIPDLTERFPEGFGGIDLTDSFFPSGRGGYEPSWDELYEEYEEEEKEPHKFIEGNRYHEYGIFGGQTFYTIKEIDRDNNTVLCSQEWIDVDGHGTRPDETFLLSCDEQGNERFLTLDSEHYGKHYVFA